MKLKGFSDYEIDVENGTVWSYKRNRYIGSKHKNNGYWIVSLWDDNQIHHKYLLHRLIWEVVYGEIPNGLTINHNDENKDNNSISNLSLMTMAEQNVWGTRIQRYKKNRGKSVLAMKDGKPQMYFQTVRDVDDYGFNNARVSGCCRKLPKYTTHKGYEWIYTDEYLADWLERYQDEYIEKEKALN